ncbi:MAG: CAP domain-containing protein [Chloroflexota bacterium]
MRLVAFRRSVRAAALAALLLGRPGAVRAQPAACQFQLAFKVLHDAAPADVGDCRDNQAITPAGDAQQHTTKGLLVWRRADNWTAFTNGNRTWLLGPQGVVSRLNTERFFWEAGAPSGDSVVAPPNTGTVWMTGSVVDVDSMAPVGGARVNVTGAGNLVARLLTDTGGHWAGHVPYFPRLVATVEAVGYGPVSQWEFDPTSASDEFVPAQLQLRSVFAAGNPYSHFEVAPTVSIFLADTGESFQQVLAPAASKVTIAGSSGLERGQPAIRSDAWVANPDDSIARVDVKVANGAFSVDLPLLKGRGRYQVEVNDAGGAAIINVPLFVGVPFGVPYVYPPRRFTSHDLPRDAALIETFEALNALRAAHGLPAMQLDQRLMAMAQDHAEDNASHNVICHCWSDGSPSSEHFKQYGVDPAKAAEGIYGGDPGKGAIDALFSSPAHRSELFGPFTRVGIGDATFSSGERYTVLEYATG